MWGGHMNRDLLLSGLNIRSCIISLALIISTTLSASCSSISGEPAATPPPYIFVAPIFREFYGYHGGQARLGKAISGELYDGPIISQWLETGKMIFDPGAEIEKFYLEPLGKQMGVETPAVKPPTEPDLHYIGGHIIHPNFWPLYEILGANMVGMPLTEAKYNPVRRRYEQYFENMGFYRLVGQPDIHLLKYGVWACGEDCKPGYLAEDESINSSPGTIDVSGETSPVFVEVVGMIGPGLTGSNLSDVYSRDGTLEQVFENVVLLSEDISRLIKRTLTTFAIGIKRNT